jgi:hypothetical protein
MSEEPTEGQDWTGEELDLIISDYFLMLNDEAAGISLIKPSIIASSEAKSIGAKGR